MDNINNIDNINLNWYNKYKLDINTNNLIDNNFKINVDNIIIYIDKLNNNCENTIENKINKTEESYYNKINELNILFSNNIENNILIYKKKNSLQILQKELEIIKILTKYTLQNKILDLDFYIPCLHFLFELSEILRNRIKQKVIIITKNNTINSLFRCSYKFCTYQDNCNYNYNYKKICYQDHYVHSNVSCDIKVLLEYIKTNNINDINLFTAHNKEILKTINTLSYVINHMETELRNKCLYLPPSEIEKFHFDKKN